MDPRRLLVLRAVARHGSLAAAARSLGTTQQAVSQQVARLESESGTALVVRRGRGSALTEAGAVLSSHADALADVLRAAETDLLALSGLVRGTVRLAAFPTATAVLLPGALSALARRAPGLVTELVELEPPEAEAALRAGEVDLAVVFRHADDGDPVPGDLLRLPLARHPLRLVLPRSALLPRGLADLADDPWIAGCTRCRAHLLRSTARAGFSPRIRYESDDCVAVQRLVAAGLGVALLPTWALDASPQPGTLALPVSGVGDRIIDVLLPPEGRRVPAVAALLGCLQRAAVSA